MFLVTVICSHGDCYEEREVLVEDLAELERLACDCGYGFVLARVAETQPA